MQQGLCNPNLTEWLKRSWWTERLSWQAVMNGEFSSSVNVHELEHGKTRLSVQWRTMMSRRSESDEILIVQKPSRDLAKAGRALSSSGAEGRSHRSR